MLIRLSFAFLGREWGKPTQSPSAGLLQALMRGLRKPCRMVLRSSDAKWLPGGSQQNELLWHKTCASGLLLEPCRIEDRYWRAFGVEDPHPVSMPSITCEISPPKDRVCRRV